MRGMLSPLHPLVGAILAISGVEIEALSYILVRNLRFEAPFRAALFILFGFPAITVLTSLLLWLFLPKDSWRWGLIHFTAAQAAAYGAAGTVCAVNLIHLYRRAGLGWRAKEAPLSRGSSATHDGRGAERTAGRLLTPDSYGLSCQSQTGMFTCSRC